MPIYLEYQGYSVEVPQGDTVVGRDVKCTLRFNDSAVSRKHLKVTRAGDTLTVEDLGSMNGTRLNGELIVEPIEIRDGDAIEIGEYKLRVRYVDDVADQLSTRRVVSLAELGTLRRASRAAAMTTPPSSRTRQETLQPERRRADRKPVELRIVYTSSELEIEAVSRDLSYSGVFVCSQVLDPVGTRCELTILMDGGPPIAVRGIVRRVVEHRFAADDSSGLGIEFVALGAAEREWLDIAIERLDRTKAYKVVLPSGD